MKQPTNKTRQGKPTSQQSQLTVLLSLLVVLAIFAVLGVMLYRTWPGNTPTDTSDITFSTVSPEDTAPTAAAGDAATQPTVAASGTHSYSAAPAMTIDTTKTYTATVTTPRGDFVIKLLPDIAPKTVNNFVFLAREGFYDGLTWHRVLANFMAQGGDPDGTGMGGPGYTVPAEFTDKISFDKPGIVAMARSSDPDSAGSQFFVTTGPATWLDGQYTIFGEVVSGQDIVDGIPLRDPDQSPTTAGEQIIKITISES